MTNTLKKSNFKRIEKVPLVTFTYSSIFVRTWKLFPCVALCVNVWFDGDICQLNPFFLFCEWIVSLIIYHHYWYRIMKC